MPQAQSQSRHEFPEIVVFTGDLVGSSKLSPDALVDAMRELELASYDVARSWSQAHPRFTRPQRSRPRIAGPLSEMGAPVFVVPRRRVAVPRPRT